MDVQTVLKKAVDIALLKEETMEEVAKDEKALKPALAVIAVVSLLSALGTAFFPSRVMMYNTVVSYQPDALSILGEALFIFVVSVLSLYVMGYLSVYFFKSKLSMNGFVRVLGFADIVGALALFPALSFISGIWALVVFCKVLSSLGKLSEGAIILLLLIELVLFFLLVSTVGATFYARGMMGF